MRGALIDLWEYEKLVRIIPADAGSTLTSEYAGLDARNHPRGCGEHLLVRIQWALRVGSSPRMRGAHAARTLPWLCTRIIPADAGSTRMEWQC